MGKIGQATAKSAVLHVDLSNFFKSEFRRGGSQFWNDRFRRFYASNLVVGPGPIRGFWEEWFSCCKDTHCDFSIFSRLLVSTIWCRRSVASQRKLVRDRIKMQPDDEKSQRRNYVFSRLYVPTPEAKQNY